MLLKLAECEHSIHFHRPGGKHALQNFQKSAEWDGRVHSWGWFHYILPYYGGNILKTHPIPIQSRENSSASDLLRGLLTISRVHWPTIRVVSRTSFASRFVYWLSSASDPSPLSWDTLAVMWQVFIWNASVNSPALLTDRRGYPPIVRRLIFLYNVQFGIVFARS